jgi:hypothetical protein
MEKAMIRTALTLAAVALTVWKVVSTNELAGVSK